MKIWLIIKLYLKFRMINSREKKIKMKKFNEKNIKIDEKEFDEEFKKHQNLSRIGAEKKFKGGLSEASEITAKLHTATHILGEALRKVLKNPEISSSHLYFQH